MKTGLRCIGFGVLLYLLNINVIRDGRAFDLVDIFGAFFTIVGLETIRSYHNQFKLALVFAVIGGIGEVLLLIADAPQRINVATSLTLTSSFALALTYSGIAKIAILRNLGALSTEATIAAWISGLGGAAGFIAFFVTTDNGVPTMQVTSTAAAVLLLLIYLFVAFWLISLFFRAARQLKDVPLGEAAR